MRKVIVVFNGTRFSESAFEFARCMNAERPVLLTGIFLPQTEYAGIWSYAGTRGSYLHRRLQEASPAEEVEKTIARFEALCSEHAIAYTVHRNFSEFALPGLVRETRFADMAIAGCDVLYASQTNEQYDYVKELLHAAECPVVLVPDKFIYPTSNILAYDGSEAAAWSIKQFSYLFPEWQQHKTLLVYAHETAGEVPDEEYINELTGKHFSALNKLTLVMEEKKYFTTWLRGQPASILVSGAFSKPYFAQSYKRSFISGVLKEHLLPVFIAHR